MDKNVKYELPHCDIILPVYNSLTYVNECIDAILENTKECGYTLHIIDDCSDKYTNVYLQKSVLENSHIILHQNTVNLGFLKSCNKGFSMGSSPYVLLINSDVIVTPFWLNKMIECAESDPLIASVNPFTNQAANINLPMPSGANFYSMDSILKTNPATEYPDVVTGVGFCILFRRNILNKVGLFDEVYKKGYCEESDLCMRLTTNGYRTVLAPNVYVYHKGKVSFSDPSQSYKENRKIFDRRWGREYKRQFKIFVLKNPLERYRRALRFEKRWAPEPCLRETYRQIRNKVRGHDYWGAIKAAAIGIKRLPESKQDIVTNKAVQKVSVPGRLRVVYVLPYLTIAGGVLSVVQLVNELILLGVDAKIAAVRAYPEIYDWKFLFRPMIFKNVPELIQHFPETDIVVATHFSTAPWVGKLVKNKQAKTSFYFLQDYESWFFPKTDKKSRAMVKKSYDLIFNKIVKSDWLKQCIENDGHQARKIRLGMDLLTFYPRDVKKNINPVLLAMARPRTPRRGFETLIKTLTIVKQEVNELEIVLFGDDLHSYSIPFEYTDKKIVSDQSSLARIYSRADIFFDCSDFQGFGRTALEAMACGTACVLTNVGGVSEYARNEKNCFLVPPKEPELSARAILTLIKDKVFREQIVVAGLNTAKKYCHKREAKQTLEYMEELMDKLEYEK